MMFFGLRIATEALPLRQSRVDQPQTACAQATANTVSTGQRLYKKRLTGSDGVTERAKELLKFVPSIPTIRK